MFAPCLATRPIMPTLNPEELSELGALVEWIYRGAIDHETWLRVPEKIAAWLQASACTLFSPLHVPEKGGFMMAHNLSHQSMTLWTSKYHARDIWGHQVIAKNLGYTGNVIRDQDLTTEEEFLSSVMYKEFFQPIDIGRLLTGIVFGADCEIPVICSCNRPFNRPFTLDDARKYQLILPHLSRALGVILRLRDA